MAKVKGICKNIDGCDLAAEKVEQEVDSFDFRCKECGKELYPLEDKKKKKKKKKAYTIPIVIAAIIALLAIIGCIIAFGGGKSEEAQSQEFVADTTPSKDSVEVAQPKEKESIVIKDTIVLHDTVAVEVKTQPKPPTSPTKDLGYASFKGTWPNDVNGRMVFKTSHIIDSKDPKKRMADANDYVIGEWSDGHLVQGIWYGSDNQVKGSVIIGK